MSKLPHFIIVGTMKSGTTSLGHYLDQHDHIYMPKNEVHFFDNFGGYADRWNRGLEWYGSQFKLAKENQIIGEKTPTYSYLEDVPARIKETLPKVKLIWIFRNPIDRAYSNYWHAVKNGGERESFEYAVNNEQERIQTDIWKGYVKRSNYAEQVRNYLNYFDLDQMLFLTFEEMKNDLKVTLQKTCQFLNVDFQPSMISSQEAKNITHMPRFPSLRYFVSSNFGTQSILSRIERKLNFKNGKYSPMPPDLRAILIEKFKDSNKELAELTNLNLDHWDS